MYNMNMIESVIALFAPHSCLSCGDEGQLLCRSCWPKLGSPLASCCYLCARTTDDFTTCSSCKSISSLNSVRLRTKYQGIAKELVRRLKFERAKAASSIIADSMLELVIDQKSVNQEQILVPLPTASSRRRQRGYDHSQLIARRLASSLGVPYRPALTRLGQARQVGSKKIDRLSQMEGAFRIKFGAQVKDKDVLLVDDVLTTGASLEAAASCLLNSGARRVDALVFARA